jgi:hypothetical protein
LKQFILVGFFGFLFHFSSVCQTTDSTTKTYFLSIGPAIEYTIPVLKSGIGVSDVHLNSILPKPGVYFSFGYLKSISHSNFSYRLGLSIENKGYKTSITKDSTTNASFAHSGIGGGNYYSVSTSLYHSETYSYYFLSTPIKLIYKFDRNRWSFSPVLGLTLDLPGQKITHTTYIYSPAGLSGFPPGFTSDTWTSMNSTLQVQIAIVYKLNKQVSVSFEPGCSTSIFSVAQLNYLPNYKGRFFSVLFPVTLIYL